jgi:hypothetical protein
MEKSMNELHKYMILLQKQLKDIDRQLKQNDRNIEKIVKRLSKKGHSLDMEQQDVEIKIRSYLDNQYSER